MKYLDEYRKGEIAERLAGDGRVMDEQRRDPESHQLRCRARSGFPLPSGGSMDKEARSELLSMMGLVAIVVAVVILVFFMIGYGLGRIFF